MTIESILDNQLAVREAQSAAALELLPKTSLLLSALKGHDRSYLMRMASRRIEDHNCVSLFTVAEMSAAEIRTFDSRITSDYLTLNAFKKGNLNALFS